MTTIERPAPTSSRMVQVAPVGASLRETEYTATPEVAVWSDRESGHTWMAVRYAGVLLEVELEPGQVDAVTAGLLDEVPVPYELVDQDDPPGEPDVCGVPDPDQPGGVCGHPETFPPGLSVPCPQHGPRERAATWVGWW